MLRRAAPWAALALAAAVALASLPPARAQGGLTVTPVLTGLAWPVALGFAPDGRWFYDERLTGNIRVVQGGSVLPQPWATLPVIGGSGNEQGLLGLAVDPRWSQGERWVYAYHTYANGTTGGPMNRIVRLFDAGGQGTGLEVVLDGIPAAGFHNGGSILFGPDGALYATAGDATDPGNAQDLLSVAGKVLRMNPDGSAPTDNPFYANASAHPLVYTYGHRNMFGLAANAATGRLYVTENGPACNDEVNLLAPGRNYGWGPSQTCGTPPPPPQNTNRDGPNVVLPLVWYSPTTAPTNAIVYAGPNATLQGDLLFGEWNTGDLRRLDLASPGYDAVVGQEVVLSAPSGILDVENGPDGFLYFTTQSSIYRVNGTALSGPGGGAPVDASAWLLGLAVLVVAVGVVLVLLVARDRRRRTAK